MVYPMLPLCSRISPGWQSSSLQMFSKVKKRLAFVLPVFRFVLQAYGSVESFRVIPDSRRSLGFERPKGRLGLILAHFSKGYKKKRDFRFNHEWEAAKFSFKSL